jgi:inner membrane protein
MRPFYPFSKNESALRAIYPFDPMINILPLLPVVIVATEFLKNRQFWNVISKKIPRAKNANKRSRDICNIKNMNLLSLQNRDISRIENTEIWNKKLNGLNNLQSFVSMNEKKLYASVIVILLIWITVLPITKMFLLNRVSDAEEAKISYKNTYPVSTGKFLAAYSYNNTHYKLLE